MFTNEVDPDVPLKHFSFNKTALPLMPENILTKYLQNSALDNVVQLNVQA